MNSVKVTDKTASTLNIPLHPCRGCDYRNICDDTIYMNQGDTCRDKEATNASA